MKRKSKWSTCGGDSDDSDVAFDANSRVSSECRCWNDRQLFKCLGCGIVWDGNTQCMGGEERCGKTEPYQSSSPDQKGEEKGEEEKGEEDEDV